jgi:hypothetical protein
MGRNAKRPPEGLKDSECKRGNINNWPPISYVQPTDLNENQKKTEIKVKLPDGTYYQMVPFQAGNNKDYVTHIITMRCLLEQKESEEDVEGFWGGSGGQGLAQTSCLSPQIQRIQIGERGVEVAVDRG